MSKENGGQKFTRRKLLAGGTAVVGAGVIAAGLHRVDWEEWEQQEILREQEKQARAEERRKEIEAIEASNTEKAVNMLEEIGVWGDLPLVHIREINPNEIEGDFFFGSGGVRGTEERLYQFYWTPNREEQLSIPSILPYELFRFDFKNNPSPEDPPLDPTIRFDFDMEYFYERGNQHGDLKGRVIGIKNYGNDPRSYLNPDFINRVIVTTTPDQFSFE